MNVSAKVDVVIAEATPATDSHEAAGQTVEAPGTITHEETQPSAPKRTGPRKGFSDAPNGSSTTSH